MLGWMDTLVRSRKHWSARPSRIERKLRFEVIASIIPLAAMLVTLMIVPVYARICSLVFISQVEHIILDIITNCTLRSIHDLTEPWI